MVSASHAYPFRFTRITAYILRRTLPSNSNSEWQRTKIKKRIKRQKRRSSATWQEEINEAKVL